MAKPPSRRSKSRMSNIMDYTRGFFEFKTVPDDQTITPNYGSNELIASATKTKLLQGGFRTIQEHSRRNGNPAASLMAMASASYRKVGRERSENRQILQLMPEVGKAARLMVASIFSPNDLTRQEIGIKFDIDGATDDITTKLNNEASEFFQSRLNLKTAGPNWVYQFGYETGASIFAVIPLSTFSKIQEDSFEATESFISKVAEPICHDSVFGFGDSVSTIELSKDIAGLESFGSEIVNSQELSKKVTGDKSKFSRDLIEKFLGKEALNLTDNPAILQANQREENKRRKKTKETLAKRFKTPLHQPLTSIQVEPDDKDVGGPNDNPVLFRLPPESVTVIHTPGEPSDHQGYLVLLDIQGNPVSLNSQDADEASTGANFDNQRDSIFSQIQSAYGFNASNRSEMNRQTMEYVYTKIVGKHLERRLGKAGLGRVEMPGIDSTLRCMFARMMQEKRTRVLFLPKELVTYMTFEIDENGYGVSKLNGIKFALGMKMALQVARVLAAIKAAMDKRTLTMKFDDTMMEQPESMIENLIQQFLQKSTVSFSTDPGYIQSQIAQKSLTVKTEGIPGMENFSVENTPDSSNASRDFDSEMVGQLDKTIINGLGVPASTMNSLNEDEYARSVTTTNLFFAMEVSIYQDIVIKLFSDLLRKYARYSGAFQHKLAEICPELKERGAKNKNNSSTDEGQAPTDKKETEQRLPQDIDFDTLIDKMTISLPTPNIAPSKAQFESLEGMTTAMTNMMNTMFPDELAGTDDKLRATIGLLRARFTATNVRNYLDSVGMTNIEIPDTNFTSQIKGISDLQNGLHNLSAMLEDKAKLGAPPVDDTTGTTGY